MIKKSSFDKLKKEVLDLKEVVRKLDHQMGCTHEEDGIKFIKENITLFNGENIFTKKCSRCNFVLKRYNGETIDYLSDLKDHLEKILSIKEKRHSEDEEHFKNLLKETTQKLLDLTGK